MDGLNTQQQQQKCWQRFYVDAQFTFIQSVFTLKMFLVVLCV